MVNVLSLSYGKDSIATIEAVYRLGLPLDYIVTVDEWATADIPACLPDMVEFKEYADNEIAKRYGIEVTHICAEKGGVKQSYEDFFYSVWHGTNGDRIMGFPLRQKHWCNGRLKVKPLEKWLNQFPKSQLMQYIGIAVDEIDRVKRFTRAGYRLPLIEINWTENDCRKWCEDNGLLAPTYETSCRDGCWFCHLQPVEQLRLLKKNYPEYWELLLKWDKDSPTRFKQEQTVSDYDKRFEFEDEGKVPIGNKFRWAMLDTDTSGKVDTAETVRKKYFDFLYGRI